MNKTNPFYQEKGLTLVELVIAMGLSTLIMLVLAQMTGITDIMFNKGEEKSYNQTHMRIAADEITNKLRYAKDLELIKNTDVPTGSPYTGLDPDYIYIYINDSDNSLVILEHEGTWSERKHLENRIETDIEKSYFSLIDESVKFEITDKSVKHLADTDKYTLTTTLNLQNAGTYPPGPDEPTVGQIKYKGIKYKK